jgi:hypothetical protein
MINRFIFSLRYGNKIFIEWARVGAKFLFLMSLMRIGLFFLVVQASLSTASGLEVFQSFIAGLRFDLLILGFIFIPVVLLLLVQSYFLLWSQGLLFLYKIYFFVIWIIVCVMNFLDFCFFISQKKRMRFEDYSQLNMDWLQQHVLTPPALERVAFFVLTLILLVIGLGVVSNIKFGNWKDQVSPNIGSTTEILWRLFLPIFGVALAARGTVEPKHLSLEHSEVSSEQPVNDMALNPIWCFDK